MGHQISILFRMQICNLFGLNELRFAKDKKKKQRVLVMVVGYLFLGLLFMGYMLSMTMALTFLSLGQMIPSYAYFTVSILVFFLLLFRAGSIMFQMGSYEQLLSFPVSKAAIVISRFLTLYISALAICVVMMLPSLVRYGVSMGKVFSFYISCILGIVLLPVLPLTLAVIVGTGIAAVSARTKRKGLVSAVLSIVAVFLGLGCISYLAGSPEELPKDMGSFQNLLGNITVIIGKVYPPAVWFGKMADMESPVYFLRLLTVFFVPCIFTIGILQRYFGEICASLHVSAAKGDYRVSVLRVNSSVRALCMREFRHYISCGIYLSNTLIGLIMMALMGVVLYFTGVEAIDKLLPVPNILASVLPFLLGFSAGIAPMTASIISIEGKQWWLLQSLPVSAKTIVQSKLSIQFMVAVPFYLVGVFFSLMAVKPDFLYGLWLVLMPLVFVGFMGTAGLYVNLSMPVFQWESEVQVVKQSGAVLVTMLLDLAGGVLPMVAGILMPQSLRNVFMAVMAAIYGATAAALYGGAIEKMNRLLKNP